MSDFHEALARRAGAAAARTERDVQLKVDAAISDFRAKMSELELAAVKIHSDFRDRLATLKDGEPGARGFDGATGERGEPGPQGEPGPMGERGFGLDDFDTELADDGQTLLLKFVRGDVTETHEIALPAGPKGVDGRDGADGKDGRDGERGERGLDGRDGLPGRDGAVGERGADGLNGERGDPGERGLDGQNGRDGKGFTVRGTYEPDDEYFENDIVIVNGGSFVALSDAPGPCPGDRWQMWSRQGKPGQKGDPGPRGERGPPGVTARLLGGRIDVEKMELVLVQDDGEALAIDLMPVAEIIRSVR